MTGRSAFQPMDLHGSAPQGTSRLLKSATLVHRRRLDGATNCVSLARSDDIVVPWAIQWIHVRVLEIDSVAESIIPFLVVEREDPHAKISSPAHHAISSAAFSTLPISIMNRYLAKIVQGPAILLGRLECNGTE